jgi:hypothetical protein
MKPRYIYPLILTAALSPQAWGEAKPKLGVPAVEELRTWSAVTVTKPSDLEAQVKGVTVTGSERLLFVRADNDGATTRYAFRQWIDDVQTEKVVYFEVDNSTHEIVNIIGTLMRDPGFSRVPKMARQEAVRLTLEHLLQENVEVPVDAPTRARKVWRKNSLQWAIGVELEGGTRWYHVSPEGEVKSSIETHVLYGRSKVSMGESETKPAGFSVQENLPSRS